MDVEIKEKENRRHVGRNLQRIRVYLGMKQEALAADLGVNQQVISKIEKQEEIEEGFLKRIAEVLGISEEVIKDFDVEKTIFNINHHNYKDANISEGATTYAIVQQINPLEKIVELYERLLKSEQDKIEILKKTYEIITARFSNLIYRRMETIENIKSNHLHLGKKIERVRRLRGMTQTELGQLLGITKQAVSKMEQTEKIDDERLEKIASALGVTTDGLKEYNEETVLYNTNNFYENCGVKNAIGNNQTFNNFPIEQTIELFEKLLEKQKEQFESLKKEK